MPRKGYKQTKEHKANSSKANKGNCPWNKGKKCPQTSGEKNANYWLGKHLSKVTRSKISNSLKGIKRSKETRLKMSKARSGRDSAFWKGGVTPKHLRIRMSIEYRLWREAVFARDNYTCQNCGIRGIYIEAHHIKAFCDYPELRFAIDNGMTLCKNCHKKTDNYKNKLKVTASKL